MIIKPIGDRILVKALKKEEKTASGIILPESAGEEKKEQGVIEKLGNGDLIKNSDLKEGQKILFGGWPKEVKDGDDVYKIVEFTDVLAIIED